MSNFDLKAVEIIFALGLSVIGYFLKLIHSDLRSLIAIVQNHETRLAVDKTILDDVQRRLRILEDVSKEQA